jgi:hypothetical protein
LSGAKIIDKPAITTTRGQTTCHRASFRIAKPAVELFYARSIDSIFMNSPFLDEPLVMPFYDTVRD